MTVDFSALSIYEVEQCHQAFLDTLSEDDFILDLQKVQKIDMAGIQLLLSLKLSLEQNAKTLKIENIHENVTKALALCGCESLL